MNLTDSHCHLDWSSLRDDTQALLARAHKAGIKRFLTIAIDDESYARARTLAHKYESIYCSCGIHPLSVTQYETITTEWLIEQSKLSPRVIALGETGLDYFKGAQSQKEQRQSFIAHINASKKMKLPLIIHMRACEDDMMRILKDHYDKGDEQSGILHCFDGSADLAQEGMARGFYLGYGGMITFRQKQEARDILRQLVPLDSLLLETDAPFLAPAPHRGKLNEPSFLIHTAQKIAEIKNVSTQALAQVTDDNFNNLFKL